MTLISLPALTPLSYNIVREITLKPQTVNSIGLSIIKGRLCMSETQFNCVGKQPCVSNRYDLSHRQIVPVTIYGLKIICFVLIIEKRFKISPMIRSLSLPSQHALGSERKLGDLELMCLEKHRALYDLGDSSRLSPVVSEVS